MDIVILLALVAGICVLCMAALASPRPTTRPAPTVVDGLSEVGSTVLDVVLESQAWSSESSHVDHEPAHHVHDDHVVGGSDDFHVEADDPSADDGYCHGDSDTSDDSDASCDSDSGDWSSDD